MSKSKPKSTPTDAAFTGSDKHTLNDLKLEPWTPDRIIAFQAAGGVFPNLGKQGWRQYRETSVYPGAVRDVCLFVYLSTLPPEDVDDATWKEAKAFGVRRRLHDSESRQFWEAYALFMKAQNDIQASTAAPKTDDTDANNDGETDDPKD